MSKQTIYWIIGAVVLIGIIGFVAGWWGKKADVKSTSTLTGTR